MSLDKAIKHGKEHRKEYTGAKSVDKTCRNHGSCAWCEENRMKKTIVREMAVEERIREFEEEVDDDDQV